MKMNKWISQFKKLHPTKKTTTQRLKQKHNRPLPIQKKKKINKKK